LFFGEGAKYLAELEALDLLHHLLEVLELFEKLVDFLHRSTRPAGDAHDAGLRVLGQHLRVIQLCAMYMPDARVSGHRERLGSTRLAAILPSSVIESMMVM
jgi:hypothetical protein